jgi:hypothetical protein
MTQRVPAATKSAPSLSLSRAAQPIVQRQCACGQHSTAGAECEECRKRKGLLQRRALPASQSEVAPAIVHEVLRSPGATLDKPTRSLMESHFRHDFSSVLVHNNLRAAESACAVDAAAFTVGPHVVFGTGQYSPQTLTGQALLAHELTHVIQQGQAPAGSSGNITIGPVNDRFEQEADRIQTAFLSLNPTRSASLARVNHAGKSRRNSTQMQRSKKGQIVGGILGGLAVGAIGAGLGGAIGGVPGAIIGGILGAGLGAYLGSRGGKVSVAGGCKNFCPSVDIEAEAKKTEAKASNPCKDVGFTYQVAGEVSTRRFGTKIDLSAVTVNCDASNSDCGGWSSKGVITIGKKVCNTGICGALASSILHEMVHDWAGWGPPYDKKNVTVPGAAHTSPDYLDEWAGRYVEKVCFGYDPWGLP